MSEHDLGSIIRIQVQRDPLKAKGMAFDPGQDLGSRAFVYRGLLGTRGQGLFPGILCMLRCRITAA